MTDRYLQRIRNGSNYPPTIGEEEALCLRGGRIEWEMSRTAGKIWASLLQTALRKLSEDQSIRGQLQSAGLWLFPETKKQRSLIKNEIKDLKERMPDIQAEWHSRLWGQYFFKLDHCKQSLGKILTRKPLHTFNRKQSDMESDSDYNASTQTTEEVPTEHRCPPIITSTVLRPPAPVLKTSYDADPNRQRSGFAFSDISYATRMDEELSPEDLVIVAPPYYSALRQRVLLHGGCENRSQTSED